MQAAVRAGLLTSIILVVFAVACGLASECGVSLVAVVLMAVRAHDPSSANLQRNRVAGRRLVEPTAKGGMQIKCGLPRHTEGLTQGAGVGVWRIK